MFGYQAIGRLLVSVRDSHVDMIRFSVFLDCIHVSGLEPSSVQLYNNDIRGFQRLNTYKTE